MTFSPAREAAIVKSLASPIGRLLWLHVSLEQFLPGWAKARLNVAR